MKKIAGVIVVSALLGLSGQVLAYDAEAGKSKALACSGCHGEAGISSNPMWPNLAGQQMGYLVKQLRAFRDGGRSDPMMSPMAMPLSDADIDNLAVYYSSL